MGNVWSATDSKGNEKIECKVCGKYYHQLARHLSKHGLTVEEYKNRYGQDAPTMSEWASRNMGSKVSNAKTGRKIKRSPTPAHIPSYPVPAVTVPTQDDTQDERTTVYANTLPVGKATLPVRSGASLDDEARQNIPAHNPNYYFNDEILETVALAVEMDRNLMITGPNGCGKTSIYREAAALCSQPIVVIDCAKSRVSDIIGKMAVRSGETYWIDGELTKAWRNGYWVVLDEFDATDPEVALRLQSVLEEGMRSLTLKEHKGEKIERHPACRIFATGNTLGRGDSGMGGMFRRRVLDEASLDRFGLMVEMDYLPLKHETKVIVDCTGINRDVAEKMVRVARDVRTGLHNEECACSFSTRRLLNWATMMMKLGNVTRAFNITCLQRLTQDDREFVKGLFDTMFTAGE